MLRQITHSLLRDNNVRFERNDFHAHVLNVIFLHFEQRIPILLVGDFDIRLRLPLFVFERSVQEKDAGVFYATAHLGVCDVLVEHDARKDGTVRDFSSGDLFDFGVALDVHLHFLGIHIFGTSGEGRWRGGVASHGEDGFERHIDHYVVPSRREFCPDAALYQCFHAVCIVNVHRQRQFFANGKRLLQGVVVPPDDNGWMDVGSNKRLGINQHFSSKNDDGRGTIANFFILGPTEFNHRLGRRMRNVYFTEYTVAVICDNNSTHWIQEHLEHRPRSQRTTNNICHGSRRGNIANLCLSSMCSLCLGV
mmetsp:Transcript_7889/g.17137  ORF Transcript_7889/g.17137 Transcript_7889/m.17137 type:complete len:307 (-) Transcript_7889:120-1040(-)